MKPYAAPLEAYVTDDIRYAPRRRDGEWIVVRQVYRDGRWYSQLNTQRPALHLDHAAALASSAAWAERKEREEHGN